VHLQSKRRSLPKMVHKPHSLTPPVDDPGSHRVTAAEALNPRKAMTKLRHARHGLLSRRSNIGNNTHKHKLPICSSMEQQAQPIAIHGDQGCSQGCSIQATATTCKAAGLRHRHPSPEIRKVTAKDAGSQIALVALEKAQDPEVGEGQEVRIADPEGKAKSRNREKKVRNARVAVQVQVMQRVTQLKKRVQREQQNLHRERQQLMKKERKAQLERRPLRPEMPGLQRLRPLCQELPLPARSRQQIAKMRKVSELQRDSLLAETTR